MLEGSYYDVTFAMPVYGKAVDGTLKSIPAGNPFLSINGVPTSDPLLELITALGYVFVPVRGVAKLSGQPVV